MDKTSKMGRPKKDDSQKSIRRTITLSPTNDLWVGCFKNRSDIVNKALHEFKSNNPNYLANVLLGKK